MKLKNKWRKKTIPKDRLFQVDLTKFLDPVYQKILMPMEHNNTCVCFGDPTLFKDGKCLVKEAMSDNLAPACLTCSASLDQGNFIQWLFQLTSDNKTISSLRKADPKDGNIC